MATSTAWTGVCVGRDKQTQTTPAPPNLNNNNHPPCSDGSVYDTKKHVWLQGRQVGLAACIIIDMGRGSLQMMLMCLLLVPNFCKVWTLARLYNEDPAHKTPEILAAARAGAEFLRKHTYDAASQRVYFCVAEDGKVWCVGCGGCELSASVSTPPPRPKAHQAPAQAVCRGVLRHGHV